MAKKDPELTLQRTSEVLQSSVLHKIHINNIILERERLTSSLNMILYTLLNAFLNFITFKTDQEPLVVLYYIK